MNETLPKGWIRTIIDYVGIISTGNTPPKKNKENYGKDIHFVKPGDLEYGGNVSSTLEMLSCKGAKLARLIPPKTVMVTCIGNLGKVGIAKITLATNQQINSIQFNQSIVIAQFGYYYCLTMKDWLINQSSATTLPIINKSKFSKAPITLPPLNEQKRIVAKLDKIIPRIDAVKERLDKIPTIIKRFRQSVLTAAVTGKLTEKWREEHPNVENSQNEFYTPHNWKIVKINNLVKSLKTDLRTGPFGTALKKSEHKIEGIPVWGIESIGKNGEFTHKNKIFVDDDKAKVLKSFSATGGDIIISRSGTVGELCILPDDIPFGLISTNLLKISLNRKTIVPKFFCFLLKGSVEILNKMSELCSGSTRLFLTQRILKSLNYLLPPLEEQKEIVRQVDKLFVMANKLEEHYQNAKEKIDKLSQSVLAKAFRGELVPQDPNDEPAEKLLERIMEEKAKMEVELKKSKQKTRKRIKNVL